MKKLTKAVKFAKKNMTSLFFFMILLVSVLIVMVVVSVLLPTTSTSVYGARLDGVEDVTVSNNEIKDVTKELEANPIVDDAKVSVSGKIINVLIDLKSTGTIDLGKALGTTIITTFKTDEKEYYDFQVFVTSAGDEGYTVIGYKTPTAESLSWTNN